MFPRKPPTDLQRLVKLGIKYGPIAYEGIKRGRGPAEELARRQMSRRNARSLAVEHADHLLGGSILPVFDGDTRVWVVFSGDEPVATHPHVKTPIPQLLRHVDLAKRISPEEARRLGRRRARRRERGAAPELPAAPGPAEGPSGVEGPSTASEPSTGERRSTAPDVGA